VNYDTWTGAIGHSNNVSCINGTVTNREGNIKFTPYIAGNVSITYNVSTGKTVITCPGIPVTLDQRSGTGGTTSVTATYGAAMPTATMPTRTGYTFNGYFTETSSGTKYYNADGSSAKNWDKTTATTLYAQWTEYVPSESNEYVDLGLSVKWATCNVGADSPYEYGENYAWGEVETKDSYEWSNYKWCNGTSTSITKYCIASYYGKVDNKTTLELSDDAASVNLGGNWRIPTTAEVEELMSECEWIWQNAGYLVVSKVNGKSIFIPSAEYCAKYWTSDMSDYSNLSDILYVSPSGYEKTYDERKKGLLIRPVLP
jgi:hypothetical protein